VDPRQSGSGPVSDLRLEWQERRPRLSLPSPPGDRSARFRRPADLGQPESSAAASGDRTDLSPVPGSPTLVRAAPVHSGCHRCPHLQEHGVPTPGHDDRLCGPHEPRRRSGCRRSADCRLDIGSSPDGSVPSREQWTRMGAATYRIRDVHGSVDPRLVRTHDGW